MNKAYRNSAYDNPNASRRVRTKEKDHSAVTQLGNLHVPPGVSDHCGHLGDLYMEQTQQNSYALNHGLMREVGQQGVHSLLDVYPNRHMGHDATFAARPAAGTEYVLDWQLQPAEPFHPLAAHMYIKRPIEQNGNYDPAQRPFMFSTYGLPST